MRKYISVLLVLALLFNIGISWPVSADAAAPQGEVHIDADTIILGFWEEWQHSDGKTWQDTDHDGDQHNPPQMDTGSLDIPIPAELKVQYDNIRYVVISFKPEQDKEGLKIPENIPYNNSLYARDKDGYAGVVAEYPSTKEADGTLDSFRNVVVGVTPPEYSLVSGNTVQIYTGGQYIDVKRPDQEKLVQGRRWLLPALIEYYGSPKKEEPLTPKEPKCPPCMEQSSITNTWEELYTWQVRHSSTSCTTVEGQQKCTTHHWTETKHATPTYSETLKATLSVNTKQGIPTDPDHPKESDRESRASWEIIPWAKRNGLNPNEVTRSGYGFEVKLQTTYSNDWEFHVPSGAEAHGGTFKGPDKAIADFYDTKGRFVERINLVPTKGKVGDKSITWELPIERYTFKDGTTIYERKHYIDINVPDGKYQVKVTVSGAGKTDLCLIQKKQVTIYGDMWDDSYTRISTQDE